MPTRSQKHGLTQSGRGWVKKVNRKTTWICSLSIAPTPEAADQFYEANFTALWQPSVPTAAETATIGQLCIYFLDRKRRSGVDPRTYDEYDQALQDLENTAGTDAKAAELTPADFARLRLVWADRFGPDRLKKFIGAVRSMFRWAGKPPLRLPEPYYGDEFSPPKKLEFRLAKKRRRETLGPREFKPDEIGKILAKAPPMVKAMVLLGLNGGLGNTDVAKLPSLAVNLDAGWIDYARGKTGIDRRVPLWPETVAAIRKAMTLKRRRNDAVADLLFVTRQARCYVEDRESRKSGSLLHKDRVSAEFNRVCDNAKLPRKGRGFYSLRRTFRTIADEHGDQRAAALVMGHEVGDVGGIYVQRVGDERLKSLVNHVRSVLGIAAAADPATRRKKPVVAKPAGERPRRARRSKDLGRGRRG